MKVSVAKAYGQDVGGLEGFGNHFKVGLKLECLGDKPEVRRSNSNSALGSQAWK